MRVVILASAECSVKDADARTSESSEALKSTFIALAFVCDRIVKPHSLFMRIYTS